MKWLLRIVGIFLGLVVVLFAVGFVLPSQYSVERSVDIKAPADKVYALVVDPREWKRWSVWNQRDPAMKIDYSGPASGAGARWSWQSATEGSGTMEFTEAAPGSRVGYRLSFPDFGMQSNGALTLAPAGTGVKITWTNRGDVGSSPVNRWFAMFMDRLVGPDFEAGLANLKKLAETP
jgi:uncharacterized protein YndB with AHSA1/START domain